MLCPPSEAWNLLGHATRGLEPTYNPTTLSTALMTICDVDDSKFSRPE